MTQGRHDFQEIVTDFLHACRTRLSAESASIFFVNEKPSSLELVEAVGSRKNLHCGVHREIGKGVSGVVAAKREPLLAANLAEHDGFVERREKYPVDTLISYPVIEESSVLAVLNVAGREEGSPFTYGDLQKIQDLSSAYAKKLGQRVRSWRISDIEDNGADRLARSFHRPDFEVWKHALIRSLASMIAHEVYNPLQKVGALLETSLRRAERRNGLRGCLIRARNELRRPVGLASSLLAFTGKDLSLDSEYMPLNTIIGHAAALIRETYRDKDVSLHLDLDPNSPLVRTNTIFQVLINILSNSYESIAGECGNISVRTEIRDETLDLFVEDDGCGIPEEIRHRIFHPFFTTKGDTPDKFGLGLSIVKELIDRWGAVIDVKTKRGSGTTVLLRFPLALLGRPHE